MVRQSKNAKNEVARSSYGLPNILWDVLAEILTPQEKEELAEVAKFEDNVREIGLKYEQLERDAAEEEKKIVAIKFPLVVQQWAPQVEATRSKNSALIAKMTEQLVLTRSLNLRTCKTMLLSCIRMAREQLLVTVLSDDRVREIEAGVDQKLKMISQKTAGKVRNVIAASDKK